MAADERNFRSTYYEKVGFRSVEEKKSLDMLLNENPRDILKLKQYCLRFLVTPGHRSAVWSLVLGVAARYQNKADTVWEQRKETYYGLYRALKVMQILKNDTPKHLELILMWLLETGEMQNDLSTQLDSPVFKGLISISDTLVSVFQKDVEAYWIARGFYQFVFGLVDSIPKLTDATGSILEKEDPTLYAHLIKIGAFDVARLDRWFHCLFSGVLHEAALIRAWDKLLGGGVKLLAFIAVEFFITLRHSLINAKSSHPVTEELNNVSEQTSEVIVNKAVELWMLYGMPQHVADARKEDSK